MTLRWSDPYAQNRWCRWFGHRWKDGWFGDHPYLTALSGPVDGIGRHHITLYCRCDCCGEKRVVAYIHESNVKQAIRGENHDQINTNPATSSLPT